MFDTHAYLDRLHYTGPVSPDIDTLNALHLAHLMTIPYENLSIIAGEPYSLDEAALFDKMVIRRRGGFCYELNILFARLLRELGYQADLVSARILRLDGSIGPNFDHAALVVYLDEPWLADVGNSRWFSQPLCLNDPNWHVQCHNQYRLSSIRDVYTLHQISPEFPELPQYLFALTPQQNEDFAPICHYKWKSPYSKFTGNRMCSRITPNGRITLTETSLITVVDGLRSEQPVQNKDEFTFLLRKHFDLS